MNLKTVSLAVFLAVQLIVSTGSAQTFPVKPVKIVVPYPAGGATDIMARRLGEKLSHVWKQPVIVENRPGANTAIGASYVAKSPGDGHTLLLATDATVSMNQYLFNKLAYDPVADFEPVVRLVSTTQYLVASTGVNAANVAELIALAKAAPGRYNIATFGEGSSSWVNSEQFQERFDVRFNHIPYKGVSEAVTGLLGDQVQLMFSSLATPLPHIRAGKLKALGVTLSQRSNELPDVPTFTEVGLTGFATRGWFGLIAPAGTPRMIVHEIANAVSNIVRVPDFAGPNLRAQGFEPALLSPEEFRKFLESDRAYYAIALKKVKQKLD